PSRRPPPLRRKLLHKRRGPQPPTRRVPTLQQQSTLRAREKIKPTDRKIRRRYRSLQQTNKPIRKRRNAVPIKKVAGVFNKSANPSRPAVPGALFRQAQ